MTLRILVSVCCVLGVLTGALIGVPQPQPALVATEKGIRELPTDKRPVPPPSRGAKRYVALGDSFSSGEGAPVDVRVERGLFGWSEDHYKAFYGDPADEGYACHRSPSAYPVGVATALGPEWGLELRACSGAKFADLEGRQNGEPPQSEALDGQAPDLITMTMGGNDLDFAEIVKACVLEAALYSAVGPNDCRTREAGFAASLRDLRAELAGEYAELQRRLAPGGRLVVLGYPRMFPVDSPGSCGAGVGGNIREANMEWLNTVSERVSAAIRAAALDTGATYVDVLDLLGTAERTPEADRHDGCVDDGDRRWVNRAVAPNAFEGVAAMNWSWHPTAGAHARKAALVTSCVLNPMTCDSPERRTARPPQPAAAPAPCVANCPDLTVSDRWAGVLSTGQLRSDGPQTTGTLFAALYLPECEAGQDGPGLGTSIEGFTTGDLTGDGWKEAVVVLECVGRTSSWPEHVVVLDGEGGPRVSERLDPEITNGVLVGTATRPRTELKNLRCTVDGGVLTVSGDARSDRIPNAAEADFAYRQTFRRDDDRWVVGPVELTARG